MSRCVTRMYYVGYEKVVETGDVINYETILHGKRDDNAKDDGDVTEERRHRYHSNDDDLLRSEKPVNCLTIVQDDLEICTNNVRLFIQIFFVCKFLCLKQTLTSHKIVLY